MLQLSPTGICVWLKISLCTQHVESCGNGFANLRRFCRLLGRPTHRTRLSKPTTRVDVMASRLKSIDILKLQQLAAWAKALWQHSPWCWNQNSSRSFCHFHWSVRFGTQLLGCWWHEPLHNPSAECHRIWQHGWYMVAHGDLVHCSYPISTSLFSSPKNYSHCFSSSWGSPCFRMCLYVFVFVVAVAVAVAAAAAVAVAVAVV